MQCGTMRLTIAVWGLAEGRTHQPLNSEPDSTNGEPV